jgi:hypothetical protein
LKYEIDKTDAGQEIAEVPRKTTVRAIWVYGLRPLCMCIFITLVLLPPALQAQRNNKDGSTPAYPVPVGERLVYSIYWDPPWYMFFLPNMYAGDAEVEIVGNAEYKGQRAMKIVFEVNSSGMLAKLSGMKIEDKFTFLSEPETFCTLQVSKKIREGKRKRQIDVEYLRDTRQLHIREYDETVAPPELKKDDLKEDIPSCVQDPLSALYFLRRFPLHPDFKRKSLVGHDDVVKEVESRVEKLDALEAISGKVPAWRLKTVALMGGLFKRGGQFKIWLSADDRQVPLQFEVKVSLGRVLGKLKETGSQE